MYTFRKPGFKARQSAKLKDPTARKAILVDCNMNNDPKMMLLYAEKDVALMGILFEIWANLDLETETWEVTRREFDYWARKTFSDGNRFNVLKRLEWLSNNGLIEFQYLPNSLPIPSQCIPNDLPMVSQQSPNGEPTPSQTPLEMPQTRVAVIRDITNQTNQAKLTSSPLPPPSTKPEEEDEAFLLTQANQARQVEYNTLARPVGQTPRGIADPLAGNQASTSQGVYTSGVQWCWIKVNGERQREDDWIWQQLCLYEGKAVVGLSLDTYLQARPTMQKIYNRWLEHPISLRMAAICKTIKESNAKNDLVYAESLARQQAIDRKTLYGYLQTFETAVQNGDYEVEINHGNLRKENTS